VRDFLTLVNERPALSGTPCAHRPSSNALIVQGAAVAPDYVLADAAIAGELVDKIVNTIVTFRSAESDLSMPIVNAKQFDRLVAMIESTDGSV
jgi:hypothetical protein